MDPRFPARRSRFSKVEEICGATYFANISANNECLRKTILTCLSEAQVGSINKNKIVKKSRDTGTKWKSEGQEPGMGLQANADVCILHQLSVFYINCDFSILGQSYSPLLSYWYSGPFSK